MYQKMILINIMLIYCLCCLALVTCEKITVCELFESPINITDLASQCSGPTILARRNVEKLTDKVHNGMVEALDQKTEALQEGYQSLNDGWIGIFNGYLYKATSAKQSYDLSKAECKNMGAELAMYGVQDMKYRRALRLVFQAAKLWIGVRSLNSKAFWTLENESRAFDKAILWEHGYPTANKDWDCVVMLYSNSLSADALCEDKYFALCEKLYKI